MKKRILSFVSAAVCAVSVLSGTDTSAASHKDYYKPIEYSSADMNNSSSQWCWQRSAESEHFYVFWEPEFGADPSSSSLPENMRVDVSALLKICEKYYRTNTERLGFLPSPYGYKIQVYINYTGEWLATGAGYDDKTAALWVNPDACGYPDVIAHEIGHCFQYLIYPNVLSGKIPDKDSTGFRYAVGEGFGCTFWEQTAQWQSMNDHPEQLFNEYDFGLFMENYNLAFENEWSRYQSYWFFYYMTMMHGQNAVSDVWKAGKYPDDALTVYSRLFLDGSTDKLYAELYDYAARMATFDIDGIREYADGKAGSLTTKLYKSGDYKQVAYNDCPEAGGFNIIPVSVGKGAKKLTVDFAGLKGGSKLASGDKGIWYGEEQTPAGKVRTYNKRSVTEGWRYGVVILKKDGTRIYGKMHSKKKGRFTVSLPKDTEKVYFIVLGAPDEYVPHIWDEDQRTDAQMPYKVRFTVKK